MEKYRVWFVINPPNDPEYRSVETHLDGALLIRRLIKEQSRDPFIWGNAFGLEVDEGYGFEEWYNELGQDVNEAFSLE